MSLWLLMYLGFGLLLSCFGHARAKNNFEAWFDLNCVSPFCWGLSPCYLYLLHGAVNCLPYCGMYWLVFRLLRVRFFLPFRTVCVCVSFFHFWIVSFPLAHRLRVFSFPFSAYVSSPAITLGMVCAMGSWMLVGC